MLVNKEAFAGNCWIDAGEKYGIDPKLLYVIAQKESGLNPRAKNVNTDSSTDVGLMQINSFWFPHLAKRGISQDQLWDACTNVHVGAWVLKQSMSVYGKTWRAVGAYNAGTGKSPEREQLRAKYAADIYRRYSKLNGKGN